MSIRNSGESSAQQPSISLPSRPFPVQAKKKASEPSTLDEPERKASNTQSALTSGSSFRDISVFPQGSSPKSRGSELPGPLRQKLERAFSTDFSDVRVHANTPDAKSLSALAFTQGRDIYFAPGKYNPASQEGQQTIAHELTHVVQQQQGKVAAPGSPGVPVNADPSLEAEADALGQQALRGSSVANDNANQSRKSQQPELKAVQLQPDDDEAPGQTFEEELRAAKAALTPPKPVTPRRDTSTQDFERLLGDTKSTLTPVPSSVPRETETSPLEQELASTKAGLRPTPTPAPSQSSGPSDFEQELASTKASLKPTPTPAPSQSSGPSDFEQELASTKAGLKPTPTPAPSQSPGPSKFEQQLKIAKQNLKKTTGMSTMYPHVNITRGGKHAADAHDDPMKFLEFATQTRRDMTNLSATEAGREIFDTIGTAGHKVTLQDRGFNTKHGGSHRAHDKANASVPGVGSDSTVTHQPDRSVLDPRPHAAATSSTISLGHELIHSTHSATGTLQSGKHGPSGIKNEERHTVGNPSGKRPKSGLPTENILRAQLAEQYKNLSGSGGQPIPRTKYGKKLLGFNPEDDQY